MKKTRKILALLMVVAMILSIMHPITSYAVACTGVFVEGSGTEDDPYLISNKYQLDNVRNNLSAHYKLTCNIVFEESDFTESGDFYNDGLGFIPIGSATLGNAFAGTFDGNGCAIENLRIYVTAREVGYAGLFGYINGTIINLGVKECVIDMHLTSKGLFDSIFVGGIVGESAGTIKNCYNTGVVSATAEQNSVYAGGIIGGNYGTIENCYNTGDITAVSVEESAYAGGIAGYNYTTIDDCYDMGELFATTGNIAYIGRISGKNYGTISNCFNTADISITFGAGNVYVGGIAGENTGTIGNCHNTADVSVKSEEHGAVAGGIVGANFGTIQNCYNTSDVSAASDGDNRNAIAGGIAGCVFKGKIENCYNTGDVFVTLYNGTYARAGGISGTIDVAIIKNCYNAGDIFTTSEGENAHAGGIASSNGKEGIIENCHNMGDISVISLNDAYAGGVTGVNYGIIASCYNISGVSATSTVKKAYAGGVTGYNDSNGVIENCYNTGEVTAISTEIYAYAGGISGYNDSLGVIEACYNTGDVFATSKENVAYSGGISGANYGTIDICYNTGAVVVTSEGNIVYAGGVSGYNYRTIKNCYYMDNVSAGIGYGSGTTTKCTAEQMKNQSTFAAFDFENVWMFDNTLILHQYPVLKNVAHNENIVFGDIDGDSEISSMDALMMKQYFVGIIDESYIIFVNADMNVDRIVNAKDLLLLKLKLAE